MKFALFDSEIVKYFTIHQKNYKKIKKYPKMVMEAMNSE